MQLTHRTLFLANAALSSSQIVELGAVDEAISVLGRIIDRTDSKETVFACEKIIEALNENQAGPLERLTNDQAAFADKVTLAIYNCFALTV